jgi:hypothetical protein
LSRTSVDRICSHFISPVSELLFFQQRKKSNQKNAAPTSLPFGSPRHSPLPTGRPDSPSGLDRTKFDVPVEFSLPKPKASANFTGRELLPSSSPKTASLVGSIDQGRSIESCRAGMRVKTTRWQGRWLRECEARAPGTCFFGYFLYTSKESNSPAGETRCLVTQ